MPALNMSKITCYLKILTPADKILVTGIGLATLFSFLILNLIEAPGSYVTIDEVGHSHYKYSLNNDKLIICHGPIGETVIRIEFGKARVLRSDCPNKICVNSGAIDKTGQIIVCVPNKIIVKIEGEQKEHSLDVVTQ